MDFKQTEIGKIPTHWSMVTLGDIADVLDPHPSHRAPQEVKEGLPFAGIGDIDEYGNIDTSKARSVSKEIIESHERNYFIDKNSIGYGRVGTVGKVVKLRDRKNYKYALSPTLAVINPKDLINASYLYTLLQSNMFFKQVFKFMTGSTRPSIGIQILRNIIIPYPPYDEQRKIGSIIKSLGDKIEINTHINKNLQSMSQHLFKHWFIDFEFPNEDGLAYKSSGGEMTDSELGMIPKGWKVGSLSEIGIFKNGKGIKEELRTEKGNYYIYGSNGIIGKTNEALQCEPCIIIGRVGAYCGSIQLTLKPSWITDNAIVALPIEKKYFSYLYLKLLNSSLREKAGGSAQPLINQTILNNIKMVVPEMSLIEKYNDLVSSVLQDIESNIDQNVKLSNLRETLLPKLMSGEIDLSNLDTDA
jgi:type I restriction enzyme S subunit